MNVTQQQINVQRNNVATQNRGILSGSKPLRAKSRTTTGTIKQNKYYKPRQWNSDHQICGDREITSNGKPLYKIADPSTLDLRAYVTGDQLPQIKLGQQVAVFVDSGAKNYRKLSGTITWVSDKAEFTTEDNSNKR